MLVVTLVRMMTLVMMLNCVVEGLDGGCIPGSPGFVESSGKTSQTVSHSFYIFATMCFWSAWKW